MYAITFAPEAKEGLSQLKRSEPAHFKKAVRLLNEIAEHPMTGTGHPEPLKGHPENSWSRQIAFSRPKFMLTCFLPTGIMAINDLPIYSKTVRLNLLFPPIPLSHVWWGLLFLSASLLLQTVSPCAWAAPSGRHRRWRQAAQPAPPCPPPRGSCR